VANIIGHEVCLLGLNLNPTNMGLNFPPKPKPTAEKIGMHACLPIAQQEDGKIESTVN